MKRPGGFTPAAKPEPENEKPDTDRGDVITYVGRFSSGSAGEPPEKQDAGAERTADEEQKASKLDEYPRDGSDRSPRGFGWWSLQRAVWARRRLERQEIKRFTARQRRRRRNILISLGAVLLVAVGSVGVAYSPIMAVKEVTVEGAKLVNSDAIVEDLKSQIGTPLPLVDQRAIKASLVKYPLIQSYTVEAVPPSTLIVRLVEREPLGVLKAKDGYSVVDAAGVVLRTSTERPAGFPVIDTSPDPESRGFTAAAAVLRALPDDVRSKVDRIEASTRDDVTLVFADSGAIVRWGSDENSAQKAKTLTELMKAYPPDSVEYYDVSSAENVVLKPR
ncbi:FtsQ-type POTRA domain-containing protein [Paramicrobacterium sp. CJ85]|uniref:FtsQ-type POTRA domain-containing protein n=1 Tax=Paramicrobacterium sp. CJ85 TaxID=3445355 RepID=UPI003F611571